MEKQVIQTSPAPRIYIEVQGNLNLKGEFDSEVVIRAGEPEDIELSVDDDEIRLSCRSDCSLRVPRRSEVEIAFVNGEAVIKALEGPLNIKDIKGNLLLKDVGPVSIEQVHGELVAKQVDGDLIIRQVHGNLVARGVEGHFRVEEAVRGNLKLEDIQGEASARAHGNAVLTLDPVAGQRLSFKANGNLVCRLPEDASVRVSIEDGGDVKIRMAASTVRGSVRAPYEIVLGDGDSELVLSASGSVLLADYAPDWDFMGNINTEFDGVAEQIARQVDAQVEEMENQIQAQMENLSISLAGTGLSPEAAERISRRAREASARASARAQEKMQRAQEKLQRKMESVQRRAEARARSAQKGWEKRGVGFDWPAPGTVSAQPAGEPVSEDERLLILKMLEEKQISLEEAEKLLKALEGD